VTPTFESLVGGLVHILILLGSAIVVWYGAALAGLPVPGASWEEARTKDQRRLGWLLLGAGLLVLVWVVGPLDPGEVTR